MVQAQRTYDQSYLGGLYFEHLNITVVFHVANGKSSQLVHYKQNQLSNKELLERDVYITKLRKIIPIELGL